MDNNIPEDIQHDAERLYLVLEETVYAGYCGEFKFQFDKNKVVRESYIQGRIDERAKSNLSWRRIYPSNLPKEPVVLYNKTTEIIVSSNYVFSGGEAQWDYEKYLYMLVSDLLSLPKEE